MLNEREGEFGPLVVASFAHDTPDGLPRHYFAQYDRDLCLLFERATSITADEAARRAFAVVSYFFPGVAGGVLRWGAEVGLVRQNESAGGISWTLMRNGPNFVPRKYGPSLDVRLNTEVEGAVSLAGLVGRESKLRNRIRVRKLTAAAELLVDRLAGAPGHRLLPGALCHLPGEVSVSELRLMAHEVFRDLMVWQAFDSVFRVGAYLDAAPSEIPDGDLDALA